MAGGDVSATGHGPADAHAGAGWAAVAAVRAVGVGRVGVGGGIVKGKLERPLTHNHTTAHQYRKLTNKEN